LRSIILDLSVDFLLLKSSTYDLGIQTYTIRIGGKLWFEPNDNLACHGKSGFFY